MPKKNFVLADDLAVTIYKRKSSRYLRLTLAPDGEVRVSIPSWAPYRLGLDFARTRQDWIRLQSSRKTQLVNGQAIGKAHRLVFVGQPDASKPRSRISGSTISVYLPGQMAVESPLVQKVAEAACLRALRRQTESLLPQRLKTLAVSHGYTYGSVTIKQLKGRWGSCDQAGNIVLNLFLMQLPWDLIDYVLLHELTHTQILRHGPPFWQAMSAKKPDTVQLRKAIRAHSPVLNGATSSGLVA